MQKTRRLGVSKLDFNRDMLTLAREANGWTQRQLAEAAGSTQGRVSKVETGMLDPTPDLVDAFATALRVPISFFHKSDDVKGIPESYHRKRMSLGALELRRINAQVNIRVWQIERLLQGADISTRHELPALDLDEYGGSPEGVARAIRSFWQLPPGPLKNLARSMENAGAVLVPMDFRVREIDGIGMRRKGLPPLVFFNSAAPGDRTRFTLAHELGHLIMHTHIPPYPEMEDEANAFAAEFLMPQRDIESQFFPRVTRQTLAALKPVWRVAMSALLRRAYQLNAIDYNRYTRLWKELSKLGYRTREPAELDFPQEEPSVLKGLVDLHLGRLRYTVEELADSLDALPDVLTETLLPDRPPLRLLANTPNALRAF